MECCGVSTETVLQFDKFYTVVRRIFELTFRTVVLRRTFCQHLVIVQAPTRSFLFDSLKKETGTASESRQV